MKSSTDTILYTSDVIEFEAISRMIPSEETGISVSGELKLDDKMSLLTDKEVATESPEETIKTYLKVIEMRELTKEENNLAEKMRNLLRMVFNGIFKGRKFLLVYTICMSTAAGIYAAHGDFFIVFFYLSCILITLGPKRFFSEVKKLLTISKRREEGLEFLSEHNLESLYNIVDNDEDIQMYLKRK